ncbi:MAG: T9SS type A sorting domain-containing protein [Owenweeksia sp.]
MVPEWVEDFETPRWTAGNGGASTTGNAHRGVFPVFYPNGNWTVTPAVDPNLANRYAWCVNSGGTATLATGPSTNHTTGGAKYIYAESSLGSPVTSTQFITPCIDLSNETRCLALEFWYHMFGSDVDLLRIDIDSGSNTADWVVNYAKVVGQQQSTSNAAWKKMIVPLGDFNGKYIRIRFFAVKRIPGDRGDIAIDDLRIYEPDSVDMEVLSLNEPKNGYCYFDNNEPVEIHIRNNGCQTATTIPVAFQVTSALNPTGVTKWDTIQTSLILGDTLTYVFTPPADLSSYDTYWVRAWTAMPGDVKPGNDMASVEDSIEYTLPITSFPYIEDFEDGIRQLQILGNDRMRFMPGVIPTYRWLINSGLTPSLGASGPFQGFGYGGKYLYSESIINDNNASKTYIRTVCVDLGSMTAPVIEFYYHMFGPSIESLEIEVSRAEEDLDTWTAVPGSKITGGTQQTSSLADWKYKKVDLSGYLGETVKIRFVASRKKLTDPDEDLVDIAIDKVMIFDEIANDAGVISINSPDLHATTGSIIDPSIKLTNHGSANFTSVPVSIRITQLCGPNAGQSTMYNDVVTSSIGRGATTGVITLSNANIPVPDGEFEICVITQLAGDTHAFNDTICKRLIGHGIDTIAYKTSFDDCNYSKDGFYFEGSFRQWELGQPTGTRIRNAYSSPNAWVTNLDGIVIPGTSEYLYTPDVVNFDTVVKVSLRFRHNMDFAAASDAKTSKAVGAIQYREILNGVEGPWKYVGKDVLGTVIRGVNNLNWYDSEFGSVLLNQIGDNPGFVGRTNGAWIQTTFALTSLDETPGSKRFRFLYQTAPDGSKSNEGWGIDDFELYIPPQNSIGIIRITHEAPIAFPNVTQTLKLTIRNTGAKFLDSADIKIIIDDVNVVVDTRYIPSPPMYTGKTETLRFQDVWQAQDVTVGLHKVEVLTSLPNGKNDNLTIDDDTIVYFTVLDTVDLRASSGVTSYCNDFERNNPDIHPWLATNTYVYQDGKQSWQWGFPNQFGLPPSGQNAWVTGLDDDYVFRDSSSLLSPIFLIDSGQGLNVKFEHWFRTEALHDGGNFEVSMDGGQSWQPIGFVFNGDSAVNWYNTPFVAALNIIRPGWSGDSEGWIKSNWPFSFDHDVQCIFRFHFESDYDNQDNGWAIDDFCLEHNDSLIVRQIIGTNESPLINESITSELSPNPTKGMAELGLYLPSPKDGKMVIVNSVGQIMEQRDLRLENGNNRLELNGSAWESGLYIVKLYIDETVITKKLIIAH